MSEISSVQQTTNGEANVLNYRRIQLVGFLINLVDIEIMEYEFNNGEKIL